MSRVVAPMLDARSAERLLADTEVRVPAFVPGWRPAPTGPGTALFQVYARFLKSLADRINQAPDKNKLACFDRFGIDLLPAQAARAPVVFRPIATAGDSRVPARTRVAAQAEGRVEPLVFETEHAIALATARLTQIVTLWPGRDAYADHSADLLAGRSVRLFEPLQPVPHVFYLAHDTLLALAGPSTVKVRLDLALTSGEPLDVEWEYWDGVMWRLFPPPAPNRAVDAIHWDGTAGLTRGGEVRLKTDCGSSAKVIVNGVEARWIRGRLKKPLPPALDPQLPQIKGVTLASIVDRTVLRTDWLTTGRGMIPSPAFAGEQKLDLTKTVTPLGARPQIGSALYLSCEEAMTKPGAKVTLRYRRVITPEETADQQAAELEDDAAAAEAIVLDAVRSAADALYDLADAMEEIGTSTPAIDAAKSNLQNARNSLAAGQMQRIADVDEAARVLRNLLNSLDTSIGPPPFTGELVSTLFAWLNQAEGRIDRAANFLKGNVDAIGHVRAVLDHLEGLSPTSAALAAGTPLPTMTEPVVRWEYWNGRRWTSLTIDQATTPEELSFRDLTDASIAFTVPDDAEEIEHAGTKARWIRARLHEGGYGLVRTISWKDPNSGKLNYFPIVLIRPPHVELVRLGYFWESRSLSPDHTFTLNDFRYTDRTAVVQLGGTPFEPFSPVADHTPTLYLGFDKPLPTDWVSLFLDIEEVMGETQGAKLVWESWNGVDWVTVREQDDTRGLALPGMLGLPWPGAAAGADPKLARFDKPLVWLRVRRHGDGPPRPSRVNGIHVNAAWAAALQTFENETLGSSNGEPDQTFRARNRPILPGEALEVRELSGARARVEEPILLEELRRAGVPESDVRVVKDPRSGHTSEVWVRWHNARLHLARPGARVYEVERSGGRVRFGGHKSGRVPPAERDNIRLASYRAGGGVAGNVPAGAIKQLLAGVLVEGVSNPLAADGGAEAEHPVGVLRRGGATIRNRHQAVAARDYEELAREATPGVAVARALPERHPSGRYAPGWVTILVVPQSAESRPSPSFALRERVRRYVAQRAPSAIARQIAVVPASYFPIGADVVLSANEPSAAGTVADAARQVLARFFHPLTGGPEGEGWPFGRDVFISDVSAILEAVPGVDFVERLALTLGGSPVGDRVAVPYDRIVVAGPATVRLSGSAQ